MYLLASRFIFNNGGVIKMVHTYIIRLGMDIIIIITNNIYDITGRLWFFDSPEHHFVDDDTFVTFSNNRNR